MAAISELNAQLDGALQLTFESEIRFQQFLLAVTAFGPMKEITDDLVFKTLLGNVQLAGAASAAKVQLPSASDVLANLNQNRAEWGSAFISRLNAAEAKWPVLGSEHSVIIGRIKKAF
jgi:hypothetical protein